MSELEGQWQRCMNQFINMCQLISPSLVAMELLECYQNDIFKFELWNWVKAPLLTTSFDDETKFLVQLI